MALLPISNPFPERIFSSFNHGAMSQELGRLCSNCSRIFQGPTEPVRGWPGGVVLDSQCISLLKPRLCCVCSIILDRHKRFLESSSSAEPKLELSEVTYHSIVPRYSEDEPIDTFTFIMKYSNNKSIYLDLTLVSAERKHFLANTLS